MSRFTKWVGVGVVALLVNTAYIAAFSSATIFYMMNVLAHLVLGLALLVALGILLVRDAELRRSIPVTAALLFLSGGFALYLAIWGNIAEHRWAFWAHIATAVLGTLLLIAFVRRQAIRYGGGWRLSGQAMVAAAAFAALLPTGTYFYHKTVPMPSDRIENPMVVPTTMDEEGGGPQSPFFPSSANTNTGDIIPSNFFMDSEKCGECHADIYEQWNSSAHHFGSFNNQFYRKSVEYMQDVVGTQPSKWCAGCHDHAVFFNGRFERPIKEQIDTPEAHAGLACTSCHAIVKVDSSMGNGGFLIQYPPLHELLSSDSEYIRRIDRFLTFLNPRPHKKTFLKPFMRENTAEFCSACHKVHLDVPVNQYRWFRGFNDYDAWQASGMSGQGARSFYYPEQSMDCGDCHMPLVPSDDAGNIDGKVHSHRFPAANTALPFVNRDAEQMKVVEDFLKSGFITVDIFAASPVEEHAGATQMIRRSGDAQLMSSFAVGEEAEQSGPVFLREVGKISAPLDKAGTRFEPGSAVKVDVVVRTRKIGHFFPGGTVDAFDIWLELEGKDATGKVIYWSGMVEDDGKGPVEKGAHFYRSYQLDGEGNMINKRNAWQARSVLYVRLIPPGAADVAHYRIKIPKDTKGPITLTAKLNYRKFSYYYTQFAYAGQPHPGQAPELIGPDHNSMTYSFEKANIPANVSGQIRGEIPVLPIVTLAQATAQLELSDGKAPPEWKPVVAKDYRERWNDWGIGLLLQGDLKGAEYAFQRVTEAEPEYADGWLNVARALIQEGETGAAKPYVEKALAINPKLGAGHYFKSQILKADGDYDGALASLRAAETLYPRDRVVLNQMGRILFLKRQYKEAVEILQRICLIDPEDLQMHYSLMLAYRGLGDQENAEREQKLFLRFKAEESAQAITAKPRMLSPEDNNERQQIHEHESIPLPVVSLPPTAPAPQKQAARPAPAQQAPAPDADRSLAALEVR
ncbi:MAG: tetratricopeptide repeat protein [Acidobacteria bacterium]|nr:tetratricopeptide repeat protein [Acidobacteriota bacterium]